MTKVIILGEQAEQKEELKKIEFVSFLHIHTIHQLGIRSAPKIYPCNTIDPGRYKTIELIRKNYGGSGMDLMLAYMIDRNDGTLYLGHFNDGVV